MPELLLQNPGVYDLVPLGEVTLPDSFQVIDPDWDYDEIDVSEPLPLEIAAPEVIDGNISLDDDDEFDDLGDTVMEPIVIIRGEEP